MCVYACVCVFINRFMIILISNELSDITNNLLRGAVPRLPIFNFDPASCDQCEEAGKKRNVEQLMRSRANNKFKWCVLR